MEGGLINFFIKKEILRPELHATGFASERHQILLLRGEFGT